MVRYGADYKICRGYTMRSGCSKRGEVMKDRRQHLEHQQRQFKHLSDTERDLVYV